MKKAIATVLFISISVFTYAQQETSANQFQATYNPAVANKDTGYGFNVNFSFTQGISNYGEVNLTLTNYKIDLQKGFYNKYFSQPVGKYYSCSKLHNLCASTDLSGLWITITWFYNGKEYKNGGKFTGQQRGTKYEYINYKNSFTPPSDIPRDDVKSGEAKIKEITVTSCSVTTETEIMKIVSTSK